jgi:hypothetical protein
MESLAAVAPELLGEDDGLLWVPEGYGIASTQPQAIEPQLLQRRISGLSWAP